MNVRWFPSSPAAISTFPPCSAIRSNHAVGASQRVSTVSMNDAWRSTRWVRLGMDESDKEAMVWAESV